MPLPRAGTSNAERMQENFYNSVHVSDQSRGVKCYKDQSSKSEEKQTHRAEWDSEDTSPLEKLVVFFYPSQWNLKVGNTLMAHPESHARAGNAWAEGRWGAGWLPPQAGSAWRLSCKSLLLLWLCGLIPLWFLISCKHSNPQQSQRQCVLPGSRFCTVLICSHKSAQLHSNFGLQLLKKKNKNKHIYIIFFITADPNQILRRITGKSMSISLALSKSGTAF